MTKRSFLPFLLAPVFACGPASMALNADDDDLSAGASDEAMTRGAAAASGEFHDLNDPAAMAAPPLSDLMAAIVARTAPFANTASVPQPYLLTHRNAVDRLPLIDASQIFPAMADLIAGAQVEVVYQTYVWENGSDPTRDLLDAFSRLAARKLVESPDTPPVRVRILVDAMTMNAGSPPATFAMPKLADAIESLHLDRRAVVVTLAANHHFGVGPLHVKAVVVDGHSAILTGANPQHHHDYARPWHDSGYRLEGDAATAIAYDFDDAWTSGLEWTCGHHHGLLRACTKKTTASPRVVMPSVGPSTAAAVAPVNILMAGRPANTHIRRTDLGTLQDQAYLAAFAHAKEVIRIETPNANAPAMRSAIIDAMTRGVRVELILSKGFDQAGESLPGQGCGNAQNLKAIYKELRKRGVFDVCSVFQPRWYSYGGIAPVEGNRPRASHTKYMTIDHQVAIVGTANMDSTSWSHSRELNIVIDNGDITRSFDAALFEPDWANAFPAAPCDVERDARAATAR